MARVCVFVDGFNVYHAMMEHRPALTRFKWLDYMALSRCYVGGKDTLERVETGVVIPAGRRSEELKQECDLHFRMQEAQLARCQLPERMTDSAGADIRRPDSWR